MNIGASLLVPADPASSALFITDVLATRRPKRPDYKREKRALQAMAVRMANEPEDVLPHFVELAMQMTGSVSAGLSLFDAAAEPDVFRWKYLRGLLATFENATTPRDNSPCGVTLDKNAAVLVAHPERVYDWIAAHKLVLAEVLLVPLVLDGTEPLGTLWMVSDKEGHFDRTDARAASELAAFVGIALRMLKTQDRLHRALDEQETIAKEMSHRLKNLFAMTDSMIRASAKTSMTPEAMADALSGRVHALAKAHSIVRRKLSDIGLAPETADFADLIRAILKPHERMTSSGASRFSLHGPQIACGSRATNGIALIVHEFATNAAKYGALTSRNGRIAICWHVRSGELVLIWKETGGPPASEPPARGGFGSVLAQRIIAGQFRGSINRDWRLEGLVMTLNLKLDALLA